jgi:L-asparagine transporter-like permease
MWAAVIVSIFSYLSIEMIAVAAGEAEDPHRAIVRAFRATGFRLAFFYLATLALIVAIVPWNEAGKGQSPFVTVMAATHVPAAAATVNFVILIAALSAMNSQLYITTRMMFSLARAGYAPRRFGELSSRGTPVAALALSTIGIALATAVNALYPDASFTIMMSISMFGAMFTWLMIFVTHLAFRKRYVGRALRFRMWFYPWGTLLGAGLMAAVLITTAFTAEFRLTLAYGIPFLALLSVLYRYRGLAR